MILQTLKGSKQNKCNENTNWYIIIEWFDKAKIDRYNNNSISILMSHRWCKSTISGVIYDILFDIHLFLSDNLNDSGNNSW